MSCARRAAVPATLAWAAAALMCALALAVAVPGVARADGDPASDVLLGQAVFTGYGQVSAKVQDELDSVTTSAQRAGYPVRIALIAGKGDLGSVPQEFGHPEKYAYFLDYEISTAVNGVVLVVMPKGFGVASGGRPQSNAALSAIPIGPGTNGLGTAAITATAKLAATAGHPLGEGAASATIPLTASGAQVDNALEILLVLVVLAALAVSAAVVARRRRRGAATTATARASR
jgi:hypothetical protein